MADRKVYHPLILRYIVATIWYGFELCASLSSLWRLFSDLGREPQALFGDLFGCAVSLAVLAGFAIFFAYMYGPVYTATLTLSEAGVEYQALGFKLFTAWNDVDHTWNPGLLWKLDPWPAYREMLVLRRSRLKAGRLLTRLKRFDGSDRLIPIGQFAWSWRTSELGQSILEWAPHLKLVDVAANKIL